MVFTAFFRKTTHLLAGLLLLTITTYGQTTARKPDLIVKKDNTAIEAVINEIEETAITYRRFSAPTGQLYRIDKAKLKYIRYANGDMEKFDDPALAGTSTAPKPTQSSGAGRSSAPASTQSSSSGTQRPGSTNGNSQASSGSGRSSSPSAPPKPQSSGSRPSVSSARISKPQAPPAEKVANDVASSASSAGIKIGVLVGAGLSQNQTKITLAGQSFDQKSELIPEALSFRGGVTAEIPLGPVAIAPSLEYMVEKFATKVPAAAGQAARTASATYNHAILTVPVILADNPDKKMGLYIGLGPFVSYAISGKATGSGGASTDIPFDVDGGAKRIRAGVNARLGVRFSALSVFALGTYTLTNLVQAPANTTIKSNALFAGLQLQYKFGN